MDPNFETISLFALFYSLTNYWDPDFVSTQKKNKFRNYKKLTKSGIDVSFLVKTIFQNRNRVKIRVRDWIGTGTRKIEVPGNPGQTMFLGKQLFTRTMD